MIGTLVIAAMAVAGWRGRHGALVASIARLEIPGRPPLETARDKQMREGSNALTVESAQIAAASRATV